MAPVPTGRPLLNMEQAQASRLTRARVLLHHLDGAMDAGHAGALAVEQLLMTLPHERLATFDADALVDYRARRPLMVYSSRRYQSAVMPQIVLDVLQDDDGESLLLLHGAEPDYRWEDFLAALTRVVTTMGVTQVVGMYGLPLAVPHTRPTFVHHHGSDASKLPDQPDFFGTVELPGTMGAMIELRMGEIGLDSQGLSAGVPHYVARDDYPAGASALLRTAAKVTGLALPVGDLEAAAAVTRAEINAETQRQSEVAAIVSALENQYDSLVPQGADEAVGQFDLPSADEIGARLEAFLEANDAAENQLSSAAGPLAPQPSPVVVPGPAPRHAGKQPGTSRGVTGRRVGRAPGEPRPTPETRPLPTPTYRGRHAAAPSADQVAREERARLEAGVRWKTAWDQENNTDQAGDQRPQPDQPRGRRGTHTPGPTGHKPAGAPGPTGHRPAGTPGGTTGPRPGGTPEPDQDTEA